MSHLVNELAKLVPWAIKEGEPNYPPNPLWKPSSLVGDLGFVQLTCDTNNLPTNVQAKDSSSLVVEIDFTYDVPNKKVTLEHKYDDVLEGTLTEQIKANGDMELKRTVPNVSENDLTILVKDYSGIKAPHSYFDVEIDLGVNSYDGRIVPYDDTVPTFIDNFMAGLNGITSQTVTALAPELLLPFGNFITAYDLGNMGERKSPPVPLLALINIIIVIIDNVTNNDGSASSAIGCIALICFFGGNWLL